MRIVVLAYQGYTLPPDIDIPNNVDVVLCVLSPSHLYKQTESRDRVMELVLAWHERLERNRERLFIWDYPVWPGLWTAAPVIYPNQKKQWLHDLEPYISGEYLNGAGRSVQEGHWFINLWYRLLWNPDLDIDQELRDYCSHFFGPAGEPMYRFYRRIIDRYESVIWTENSVDYAAGIYRGIYGQTYTPEVIRDLEGSLNEAMIATNEGRSQEPYESIRSDGLGRPDIHHQRVMWMRQWAEEFSPVQDDNQGRMGFFVEARNAHQWIDRVPEYSVSSMSDPINIHSDHSSWDSTPSIFLIRGSNRLSYRETMPVNRLGFPADVPTRVQLLHDSKHVYVLFRCSQMEPVDARDAVRVAFYQDRRSLFDVTVHGDGQQSDHNGSVKSNVSAGAGFWKVMITIPRELIQKESLTTLRADLGRIRFLNHEEGAGVSRDELVLPLPVGAEAPSPNMREIHYTWSPLIDGQLGWSGFPWRQRGILTFE